MGKKRIQKQKIMGGNTEEALEEIKNLKSQCRALMAIPQHKRSKQQEDQLQRFRKMLIDMTLSFEEENMKIESINHAVADQLSNAREKIHTLEQKVSELEAENERLRNGK